MDGSSQLISIEAREYDDRLYNISLQDTGRVGTGRDVRKLPTNFFCEWQQFSGSAICLAEVFDMIGQTISHYKILEKLGEGGMGIVYKAQDTKLDRFVALKFLPAHLSASEADKTRFIQEAKAASALNHPNVCTVYSIDEHEGQLFIAMEYVDGLTLREKSKSQIPNLKSAIDIGIQIADGLAAAHEKGIVHRDIKPENIMVRKDGIAQIMDFGLAKLRGVSRLTKEGSTVGTAGYMSPEQVQGVDADHRSDIFSLGVLLYEMITGQTPFKGVHETAMMYEIVNVEAPPMSSLKPGIDPELDRIVLECLDKDPNERTQSAKQVAIDLKRVRRESGKQRMSRIAAAQPLPQGAGAAVTSRGMMARFRREPLAWSIVAFLLIVVVGMTGWILMTPSVDRYPIRTSVSPPDSVYMHSFGMNAGPPVISPDGRNIVFVGVNVAGIAQLYIRHMDESTATPLEGTTRAEYPFWSHDGKFIAFFSNQKLRRVPASGGPVVTISGTSANPRGGSWGMDNTILIAPDFQTPILRVRAEGGTPDTVTRLDNARHESSHRWPFFLPDGEHFLYFARVASISGEAEGHAVFVCSLDGTTNKLLVYSTSNALFASGYLLFVRGSTLVAQRFDDGALELKGDPIPIAEGVINDVGFNLAVFSASRTGILIYQNGTAKSGAPMLITDRKGNIVTTLGETVEQYRSRFSPDGRQVSTSLFDTRTFRLNLWLFDIQSGARSRWSTGPGEDASVWSPDGKQLVYTSILSGQWNLYRKSLVSDGPSDGLLFKSTNVLRSYDWSRDGSKVVYGSSDPAKPGEDLWIAPMEGDIKPYPLVAAEFDEGEAQFSPDGKWITYRSDENGEYEIYVRSLESSTGRGWKISPRGGYISRWGKTSEELLFVANNNTMMLATLQFRQGEVVVKEIKKLFTVPVFLETFDVSRDGSRILMTRSIEPRQSNPLSVVVNWDALLGSH